jgi:hypothetical protein
MNRPTCRTTIVLDRLCKQESLECLTAYNNETSFTSNNSHALYAYEIACQFGRLDLVYWLINNSDKDNRYFNFEGWIHFGLDTASKHKQPKVFRYLLSVCPQINHVNLHTLFQWSCRDGSKECAEILLDMYPDIDITYNSHVVFRKSCKHLDVALWLQSLKPWLYKVSVKNGKVVDLHVNTPQEQAFYYKKYPLWLMSSNSPNKKSIFYRLPEEISKMIIHEWLL